MTDNNRTMTDASAKAIEQALAIARDNGHYGIGNRQYVTNVSKARELSGTELGHLNIC